MGATNPILVFGSPLGEKRCSPVALNGKERLNGLFHFDLTLVAHDDPIAPEELLGEEVSVTIQHGDLVRELYGIVCGFTEIDPAGDDTFEYTLEIVPPLWVLGICSHNRIFEEMDALDIVETVVSESCGMSLDRATIKTYTKRETCCQFDETDLQFVERLLAEEGIAYGFKHDGECKLVLADSMDGLPKCEPGSYPYKEREESGWKHRVSRFKGLGRLCSKKLVSTDYGEYAPGEPVSVSHTLSPKKAKTRQGEMHLHGRHNFERSGDSRNLANAVCRTQVQRWLEGMEAEGAEFQGESGSPTLTAGHRFDLEDAPAAANGEKAFLLTEVHHSASDGEDIDSVYSCSFTCVAVSNKMAFTPEIIPERPRVWGPQTAKVDEVKNPEQAGAHAEVKVLFPWDQNQVSCWARVAQLYAGNQWGSFFVPDVGQEVLVEYVNGDPDRPYVVGAVYNKENPIPPYTKWQSGIKTRSDEYNELRFDDNPGAEEVYFQAGKDHNFLVQNDETGEIGNDQSHKIGNNQTLEVGVNQEVSIGQDQSIDVGANVQYEAGQSISIKAGTTIDIEAGAKLTLKVGGSKIEMTPAGVTIESTLVDVKGTVVNVKGSAATEVSGNAMLTLRGGITRIN